MASIHEKTALLIEINNIPHFSKYAYLKHIISKSMVGAMSIAVHHPYKLQHAGNGRWAIWCWRRSWYHYMSRRVIFHYKRYTIRLIMIMPSMHMADEIIGNIFRATGIGVIKVVLWWNNILSPYANKSFLVAKVIMMIKPIKHWRHHVCLLSKLVMLA